MQTGGSHASPRGPALGLGLAPRLLSEDGKRRAARVGLRWNPISTHLLFPHAIPVLRTLKKAIRKKELATSHDRLYSTRLPFLAGPEGTNAQSDLLRF